MEDWLERYVLLYQSLTTFRTKTQRISWTFLVIWNEAMLCKRSFSITLPSDTEVGHVLSLLLLAQAPFSITVNLFRHPPLSLLICYAVVFFHHLILPFATFWFKPKGRCALVRSILRAPEEVKHNISQELAMIKAAEVMAGVVT